MCPSESDASVATRQLLESAAARAADYVINVRNRRVSPSDADIAALSGFVEPFPDAPCPPEQVLATLDQLGSPATMASSGGRYFGFVIGGTLPGALAANWLAGAWDQNAALRVMSPVAAVLEDVALRWVYDVLGLPADCEGGIVTGATAANFTALAAARQALLERQGWDVVADGLFGAPPIEVIVGAEVHASVLKALGLLGLGNKRVTIVEADNQGRMRPEKLPSLRKPAIICIQAGNVNTGAFDPADAICEVAKASDAWVHVDGAFGLWAAASPKYRHLVRGYEKADSWATDAHKWPNVSYDCGLAITRHPIPLRTTMGMSAEYLATGAHREPMHHTPEASRRARGVELWAALKSLGRDGLADLVERTCGYAQRFAQRLDEAGFHILNDVVINQVLVSFGSPEQTRDVIQLIQQEGTCWCGGTVWQGNVAMRISVCSWATTEEDVDRSVAAMIRLARSC